MATKTYFTHVNYHDDNSPAHDDRSDGAKRDSAMTTEPTIEEIIQMFIDDHLDIEDFGYLVVPNDSRLNSEAASVIKQKFQEFAKNEGYHHESV